MFVRRVVPLSLLMLLVAGATAIPAGAQSPPPTLDGEILLSLFSHCNAEPNQPPPSDAPCAVEPPPPVVEATCDEDGTSTLHYDITEAGPQFQGPVQVSPTAAAGPYPGTFREEGTVTIGPQDDAPVPTFDDPDVPAPFDQVLTGSMSFNSGELLTWSARFEINSGDTTIVGRKTLTAEASGFGVCTELEAEPGPSPTFTGGVPLTGYFSLADARLSYSATINTEDGVFRDRGSAQSDVRETFATYPNVHGPGGPVTTDVGSDVGVLVEFFHSDLDAVEPAGKDACKRGGWADFGGMEFRNQGDCVSFFATEGSNEPGQNIPN